MAGQPDVPGLGQGAHDLGPEIRITLRQAEAEALAALLPMLGCGEEAAALAFDGLTAATEAGFARQAMAAIAAEERVHDALLQSLMQALPPPPGAREVMRRSRRFHISLGCGGVQLHLTRIAAIDAAVCTLLSRLLRAGAPLGRDPAVHAILGKIRGDEARHVRISRTLVLAAGVPPCVRDAAAAARQALAHILMLEGGAFEALAVNPDALFRELSVLPDGLLAA